VQKLEIMLQSPDAEKMAEELMQELSPNMQTNLKKLRTRGVDATVIISAVITGVSVATNFITIAEWYKNIRKKQPNVIIKARYEGKEISLDLESLQKLML